MTAILAPAFQTWRWPLIALVASLAMLASAHAFERLAYFLPCQLCLRQREVYWAAATMAVTGLALWNFRQNRRFLVAFNVMLALVFLTGAVVAIYHSGVEWGWWEGPADCTVGAPTSSYEGGNLLDQLNAVIPPSCTQAAGRFLGLSFAGWNVLASALWAAIALRAAFKR